MPDKIKGFDAAEDKRILGTIKINIYEDGHSEFDDETIYEQVGEGMVYMALSNTISWMQVMRVSKTIQMLNFEVEEETN